VSSRAVVGTTSVHRDGGGGGRVRADERRLQWQASSGADTGTTASELGQKQCRSSIGQVLATTSKRTTGGSLLISGAATPSPPAPSSSRGSGEMEGGDGGIYSPRLLRSAPRLLRSPPRTSWRRLLQIPASRTSRSW
jgi:hypothetical protein